MTKIVPLQQREDGIIKDLEVMRPQFARALANAIPSDRFVRVCLTEFRKIKGLRNCSRESILGAFMVAAQLQLEPGINCHILPFGKEAQFVAGYRGLVDLMWRSDRVRSVQAEVVHKGDEFSYRMGTRARLDHVAGDNEDPKDITHAYALCETTTGGMMFRVMTKAQLDRIKEHSPSGGKNALWTTHYDEACKKTALIRLAKIAPSSVALRHAVELETLADIGQPQHLGETLTHGNQSWSATQDVQVITEEADEVEMKATPAMTGEVCPGCGRHERIVADVGHASDCKAS